MPALESRLLRAEGTTGKCYVITFSPNHNITLADMPAPTILPVIDTWTKIYTSHIDPHSSLVKAAKPTTLMPSAANGNIVDEANQQYRYMQIFENKGQAMGCSNPHPHGQVWTTTSLPEEAGLELQHLQQYRREQGGCNMLEDYAKLESEKGERTVFENRSFWAGCPWWGVWPFEIMVVAKEHKRALVDLDQQNKEDLAEVIAEITRRYDNLFETSFPYSELSISSDRGVIADKLLQAWVSTKHLSLAPRRRSRPHISTCTSTRHSCGAPPCGSSRSATR